MLTARRPPADTPADPPTDPPDDSAATITETVALPGRCGQIHTNASWGRVIGYCHSLGVQCIADDRDTAIAMLRAACQLRVDAIGQFVRAEYRDAGGELPDDSTPTGERMFAATPRRESTTQQHAPFVADGYPCIVHQRNDSIHGTWEAFCPELHLQSRNESRSIAIDMLKAAVHQETEQMHPRVPRPDTEAERAVKLLGACMIGEVASHVHRQDRRWPEVCETAGLPSSPLYEPLASLPFVSLIDFVRLANAIGCEWRCELVPQADAQEAK